MGLEITVLIKLQFSVLCGILNHSSETYVVVRPFTKRYSYFNLFVSSDDGNIFIYERPTNEIAAIYKSGGPLCPTLVQPHPKQFLVATGGGANIIRLWSPKLDGFDPDNRVSDIAQRMYINQQDLSMLSE